VVKVEIFTVIFSIHVSCLNIIAQLLQIYGLNFFNFKITLI